MNSQSGQTSNSLIMPGPRTCVTSMTLMMNKLSIAKSFFAVLFLFGALVQLNDPDPLVWLVIYLVAALVSIFAIRKPRHLLAPVLVFVVTVVWALTLVPAVIQHVPFTDMFGAWEMKNEGIEKSREMYGLLIIASWMALLSVSAIKKRRSMLTAQE